MGAPCWSNCSAIVDNQPPQSARASGGVTGTKKWCVFGGVSHSNQDCSSIIIIINKLNTTLHTTCRVIVVGGGAGDSPGNGAASDGAGNVAASSSTGTAATEGAAPLDDRKQRGRRASVTSLQPLQGAHSASLPHSPDSPVAVLSPAGLRPAGRTLAAPLLAGGGGTSTRSLATSSPASRQWQRFERSQLPASRNMEGVSPINTSGQRGFPGGNTTSATNATAASDAPAGHTHTPERRAGSIPGTRRGGGARRPSQKLARHRRPRVGAAANVVAADDDTAATAATVVAASGGSATPSRSNGHGGRIGLSDSPSSGTGPSPSPPEDSYSDSGGGGGSGALTPTAPTARSAYSPMPFAAGGNGAMSNCRRHPHPRARTRRPTRGPGRAVGGDDSEGRVLTAPVAVGRPKTTKRDSHVGGAREPKYGNIISGDDVAPSSGAGAQRRPRVVPSVTSSFSSVSPLTAATGATGGSFGAISSASVSAGDVLSSAAPGATTVMVTAASSSASQATTVAPLLASGAPRSRSLRTLHSIPELKKMVASGETAGGVAAREDGLGQVAARGATNVGVLLQGPDSPIKASVQAAGFPSGGGAASRSSSPSRYDTVHPLAHKQPLRSSRPRGAPSGSNSLRPASVRQQRTVAAVASADAAGGEEGTTRRAVRRLSGGSISSVDSASGNNFRLGRVASPRPSARRGGGGAAGAGSGASSSNGAAASTQVAGPPSRRPQGRPRRQPSDVRRPTRSTSHTVASQLGVGHAASGGTAAMVDVESPAGVTGRTSMLLATPSPASLPSLSDTVSSPSPARMLGARFCWLLFWLVLN